jgi:NAD(P)-dependent dehydrogenase (short-subunit alcohol dehydrogenase family)
LTVTGKIFIVTGASSGIGEELARELAAKGAHVVCAARRSAELERVCASIHASGGSALAVPADVTVPDEVRNLVQATIDRYGGIDCLVLNAGTSMWARFDDISSIAFFRDLMDTNYLGAVHCCHAAFPYLKASHGKIVSCSTAQALMGFPNHSGYAASKHALHGFLSTVAIENAHDITILEVVMGWVRGTGLRTNAFGPDGRKHGEAARGHTRASVGVAECARRIVRAVETDTNTVYIPAKLRLVPFMNMFFQRLLRRRVTRAVDRT